MKELQIIFEDLKSKTEKPQIPTERQTCNIKNQFNQTKQGE